VAVGIIVLKRRNLSDVMGKKYIYFSDREKVLTYHFKEDEMYQCKQVRILTI